MALAGARRARRTGAATSIASWRHGGVDLVFRDRELSDKIGFAYAHGDAQAGVADLLGARARTRPRRRRRRRASRRWCPSSSTARTRGSRTPASGEPFLRALFAALSSDPQLAHRVGRPATSTRRRRGARFRSCTRARGSTRPSTSGSAIPIKNRAWELLGRARARFDRAVAEGATPEQREAAFEHLLAAEGSDWFWWFGEPFHSMEDALFDALFRAHLAGAYGALGLPAPRELDEPVAAHAPRPVADSAVTRAVRLHPPAASAATASTTGRAPGAIACRAAPPWPTRRWSPPMLFGFDSKTLYLRLEPADGRAAELAAARLEVDVAVSSQGDRHALVSSSRERRRLVDGTARRRQRPRPHARAGGALRALGARANDRLLLTLRLFAGDAPLARYPADGALALTVPGDGFEAENWSA